MNYCSRTRHQSKIYPDVSFTLHKMTERRRVQRELDFAELRLKVVETSSELQNAVKEAGTQPAGRIDKLNASFGVMLHAEWYPAWIRWGLYSVEGLEIDDQPATIDSLLSSGPSDLVKEIFESIIKEAGLSTDEEKTLPSAGTSGAPEDGKTLSSTAPNAGPLDGGVIETAPNTTPAT